MIDSVNWQEKIKELAAHPYAKWVGIAAVGLIVIIVGVSVIGGGGDTYRLSDETPLVLIDEVLSLRYEGEEKTRVRIASQPAEQWQEQAVSFPAYLEPVSPLYEVTSQDEFLKLVFTTAEAGFYDLYQWDQSSRSWEFVPVERASDGTQIRAAAQNGQIALFRRNAVAPLIGTVLTEGQTLDGTFASELNILYVEHIEIRADGTIDTSDLNASNLPPARYALLPILKFPLEGDQLLLLSDKSARGTLVETLAAYITAENYGGIVIEPSLISDENREDFQTFIGELTDALHDQGSVLALRLPTPTQTNGDWDTGGYDWQSLGQTADILIISLPGGPADTLPGGLVEEFLRWGSGEVSGVKLHVTFSSLSVDEWGGQLYPLNYAYALEPLGVVDFSGASADVTSHPEIGESLSFDLIGQANNLSRDEASGIYYYEVRAGGGTHRIWLMTAAALRAQLDHVAANQIGGIILDDLLSDDTSGGILKTVQEFKVGQPSTLNPLLSLEWQVADGGGRVITQITTDVGEGLAWTPESEGDYLITASLAGLDLSDRGALAVIVGGQTVGIAPEQEAVVVAAADGSAGGEVVSTTPLGPIPADMPTPVVPAGLAGVGAFELGGQVNHVIRHPNEMRQSGMTWVKFQLAWGAGDDPSTAWDLIERGRADGFKVLISIVGNAKYPTDIEYEAFIEFVEGVAYYGPDAIEVWNEVNIDFEWPKGQIDGGDYTRKMLAPAYNAIKSVNRNIMVISAAPAPTGAFNGEGGCSSQGYGCDDWLYLQQMAEAGAANYMDCVGAHYNSGATSPTWNTGHPADPGYQHYSWYYKGMLQLYGGTFGHPVCFTELGYLSGDGIGTVPDRFDWARNTGLHNQATWLAEAAQLSRESGQVRLMIVWNVDFTFWGDDPMSGFAIIRPDGSCPACAALGSVMP